MLFDGLGWLWAARVGATIGYRSHVFISGRVRQSGRIAHPCGAAPPVGLRISGRTQRPDHRRQHRAGGHRRHREDVYDGSSDLFQEFHRKYWRKIVSKNSDLYLDQKLEERRREYQKFGETVYLLEPNVKKSKGGLRDLHLLQWAGMARFQAPTIRELSDRGILSRADSVALTEAREFLWRVRALLHVHAGAAQEILTFDEQVWLAQHFGYHDQPHLLAVE